MTIVRAAGSGGFLDRRLVVFRGGSSSGAADVRSDDFVGRRARARIVECFEHEHTDGLYTVALVGLPLAAEGESWDEAIETLVDDIREYCDVWVRRLRTAPNHSGNEFLVDAAREMTDPELQRWLRSLVGER